MIPGIRHRALEVYYYYYYYYYCRTENVRRIWIAWESLRARRPHDRHDLNDIRWRVCEDRSWSPWPRCSTMTPLWRRSVDLSSCIRVGGVPGILFLMLRAFRRMAGTSWVVRDCHALLDLCEFGSLMSGVDGWSEPRLGASSDEAASMVGSSTLVDEELPWFFKRRLTRSLYAANASAFVKCRLIKIWSRTCELVEFRSSLAIWW